MICKKIFLAAFLTVILAFSAGCTQRGMKPEEVNYLFQGKAHVSIGEQKMDCSMNRAAPGIMNFRILSGELSGLTYDWSGDDFSVAYGGLTAHSGDSILPRTSFAAAIRKVLDYAEKNPGLDRTAPNEFSGETDGLDFILTADPKTGDIRKISIPNHKISVEFYDWSKSGL